jgi:selenocysteine lyase/cysteine desulfurase
MADTSQFSPNAPADNAPRLPEQDVLRHLLELESQASALVDDAQAEADRRVSENEKENRARYDEQYGREAAELNGNYEKQVQAVKEEYQRQLEAYRDSITALPVHGDAFAALAESLLFLQEH